MANHLYDSNFVSQERTPEPHNAGGLGPSWPEPEIPADARFDHRLKRDYNIPSGIGLKIIEALRGPAHDALMQGMDAIRAKPREEDIAPAAHADTLAAKKVRCLMRHADVPLEEAEQVVETLRWHPRAMIALVTPDQAGWEPASRVNREFPRSPYIFNGQNRTNVRQKGVGSDTIRTAQADGTPASSQPMPSQVEVAAATATLARHYCVDPQGLHLGLMAVAAGQEVAARVATAATEELKQLRDLRRLWDLRLDLHQKEQAALKLPKVLTTPEQYKAAKGLETTCNDLRKLETELNGPDRILEKSKIVQDIKRRASNYERNKKRSGRPVRPYTRRGTNGSVSLAADTGIVM